MSCCNNTHELKIITLGSSVTRTWIRLVDGLVETNPAVIAQLEASLSGANCSSRKFLTALPAHLCIPNTIIPSDFIPYSLANGSIAADFPPSTNVTDFYIHAIFEYVNGQGFDVITQSIFSGATPGVIATDIVAIQATLDAALVSAGYSVGQAIYTIDTATNELVIWHDPSLSIPVFGIWGGSNIVAGTYTNKVSVKFPFPAIAPEGIGCSSCREVQLEKWLETDGITVIEELYEIGTRNLVTPLANEILGFGGCPAIIEEPVPVPPIYNYPVVEEIGPGGAFTVDSSFKSVSYRVSGSNGVIETSYNSLGFNLLDGETGTFDADPDRAFDSNITFTTGANTTIRLNGIRRI